jgi:hypothetical protein
MNQQRRVYEVIFRVRIIRYAVVFLALLLLAVHVVFYRKVEIPGVFTAKRFLSMASVDQKDGKLTIEILTDSPSSMPIYVEYVPIDFDERHDNFLRRINDSTDSSDTGDVIYYSTEKLRADGAEYTLYFHYWNDQDHREFKNPSGVRVFLGDKRVIVTYDGTSIDLFRRFISSIR